MVNAVESLLEPSSRFDDSTTEIARVNHHTSDNKKQRKNTQIDGSSFVEPRALHGEGTADDDDAFVVRDRFPVEDPISGDWGSLSATG